MNKAASPEGLTAGRPRYAQLCLCNNARGQPSVLPEHHTRV